MPAISPAAPPTGRLFGGRLDWRLSLLLVVAVHLVSAGWHVSSGALNTDEGFYAVATRAVAQGEVPYRDFGFTQPPLSLYVNSVPLRLFGFGLFAQRWVNGLWGAAALALAAIWLGRRTRPELGLALAFLFSLSAPWMYFVHLGKTYGLTALLVMLAAAVFLALPTGPRRNFLVGLFGGLGVATRLPAAPFFAVLWLATLWTGRRPALGEVLAACAGPVLGLAVAALPAVLADPANAWFWMVEFHRISVPNKNWHLAWQEIVTLAPGLWLLAGAGLFAAGPGRRIFGREGAVFFAATAALGTNLLQRGVYEEYAVPFLLPLAACSAAWLHDRMAGRRVVRGVALFVLVVIAQFAAAPVILWPDFPDRRGTPSALLTPNAPRYNSALPDQLAAARQWINRTLPPGAPFVGTNLILAAETGRAVPAELRMGPFSYTDEMPADQAARLHFATRDQLDLWLNDPATQAVAFFRSWELNYGWSLPSYHATTDEVRQHWLEILRRDYRVALTEGQFVVLVRRDPAAGPAAAPAKP